MQKINITDIENIDVATISLPDRYESKEEIDKKNFFELKSYGVSIELSNSLIKIQNLQAGSKSHYLEIYHITGDKKWLISRRITGTGKRLV